MQIETPRLTLSRFTLDDADDLFRCITPGVTRFLAWDPPSLDAYRARCAWLAQADERVELSFVIRRKDANMCLGAAGVERLGSGTPELGIWMRESAHGLGYGREAVEALAQWAARAWHVDNLIYPVAVENLASRRIAEGLGGEIVATRSGPKYDSVVYRIPGVR